MIRPASDIAELHARILATNDHLAAARTLLDAALTTLEEAIEAPSGGTAAAGSGASAIGAHPLDPVMREHRRSHRPGHPARLDSDAELRAFVLARIEGMTFEAIADAVAAAFPPERRVRKTAIHRWWSRRQARSHPR